MDLAARELASLKNFVVDAGGDMYFGGRNAEGNAWTVGIRHPRDPHSTIEALEISNAAVCTSGDYERRLASGEPHILDPRRSGGALEAASVTVVAPLAMVADGLATAAFVLGPSDGIDLLRRHGVRGVMYTTSLDRVAA